MPKLLRTIVISSMLLAACTHTNRGTTTGANGAPPCSQCTTAYSACATPQNQPRFDSASVQACRATYSACTQTCLVQ